MLEHWSTLFESDKEFLADPYQACFFMIQRTLAIPKPDIQRYLISWAALLPTRACVVVPRLFSFGAIPGTGKSTTGKIIKAIRGFPILQSGATGASIRNTLMSLKYSKDWLSILNDKDGNGELPPEMDAGLICDDINPTLIQLDQIRLSILKSGIDRSCSTITIANPGTGQNLEFDVFGLISLSSCFPLWAIPDLFELKRRILIFSHKPYEHFTDSEKELNTAPDYLENLDFYDFRGFNLYDSFYTEERIKEFQKILKSKELKSALRDSGLPATFQFLISSVAANGLLLGKHLNSELNYDFVMNIIIRYYKEIFLELTSEKSALESWLELYIKEYEDCNYPPYEIPSDTLLEKIQNAFDRGEIMESMNREKISFVLYQLGYKQCKSLILPNSRNLVWRRF